MTEDSSKSANETITSSTTQWKTARSYASKDNGLRSTPSTPYSTPRQLTCKSSLSRATHSSKIRSLHQHSSICFNHLNKLPNQSQVVIIGGGVIGTEYASMMSALGVRVTLIEGRNRLLEFLDTEISEALQYHLRQNGMTLRMGERVMNIVKGDAPAGARTSDGVIVEATLESGKIIRAECLLYCIGRQGATDKLGLENVGIEPDNRGRIKVNENYQTDVPNIYACGDVIGFPALASTSMEQGRHSAAHMFGVSTEATSKLFPFGMKQIVTECFVIIH